MDNGDIILKNVVCRKIFLNINNEVLLFWGMDDKVKVVVKLKI